MEQNIMNKCCIGSKELKTPIISLNFSSQQFNNETDNIFLVSASN